MVQSLKLGLYHLSTLKVTCKPPEIGGLSFGKFRAMSNKQSSSPPLNGNAVNDSSNGNGNGNLGDDAMNIEKMTVQQLRSKLRDVGVPAKGSKDELISALRRFLNLNNGDHSTTLLEETEMENVGKRSSKRISRKDHLLNELNIEAYGTKRGKRASETSGEQLTASSKTYTKEEISVESLPMEDERDDNEVQLKASVKAKRKVRLKNDSLNDGTTDIVDSSVSQSEPWTVFAHKKPQEGWIAYNPRSMRQPPLNEDTKHLKLVSWNVNGLRALLKLDTFHALAQRENFDVLCLQETKLQERDVEAIKQSLLDGYEYSYWTCSISKLGYSGTAVISRIKPVSVRYGLGISDHDTEGRLVTVEFDDFFLLNGYVPNSGDGLRRLSYRVTQWDPSLANYMKELEKSKPVILTGDLNCAHEEIDIYNPAGNKRSAGFTIEERQSFEANFLNKGFVDTFRRQHPGVVGYTYWGYRHGGRKTNRGWRLDYFLVSESVANNVHDSYIVPDITGSDHCPIGIILKI